MYDLKDFIIIDWMKIRKAVTENKESCIAFVKKYIHLGMEYRSYGVIVFEREYNITNNIFEKIALGMRINGDCEEYTFNVLGNLMNGTSFEPLEYFYNVITFQFIMLEYEDSVSVHILIKMLSSFLGMELFDNMLSEYNEYFR